MNVWQLRRARNGWPASHIEWTHGNKAYVSVVFSWHLSEALERCEVLDREGYLVSVGGPAVDRDRAFIDRRWLTDEKVSALSRHNPNATFTTRGCIRRCPFCIVPQIEGDLVELSDDEWEPKPIVCDNNLLAASLGHFDHVIDRLIEAQVEGIDFNQGLDARLLVPHHTLRFRELHERKQLKLVRLAWDNVRYESSFRYAYGVLRGARIPKSKIRVYVLIGFEDSPEDALYRLETIWKELKIIPNPMRYQPIDARKKNEYVGRNWTHRELQRYMRYWANLRHTSSIPFDEFRG